MWFGDSGQGDVEVGARMMADPTGVGVCVRERERGGEGREKRGGGERKGERVCWFAFFFNNSRVCGISG